MEAHGRSWGHFYKDAGDREYSERHQEVHREFLDAVSLEKPARLLEAGCGSGIMSVYFSKRGAEVTALDRDAEVLSVARRASDGLGGAAKYVEGDLFDLPFGPDAFDAVFSQGVLEHFDDAAIRRAVTEQLRVARVSWVSVPSRYYRHRDFGDERLLTDRQWEGILAGTGKVTTRYYFYQRVKRNFCLRRPLMLMIRAARS